MGVEVIVILPTEPEHASQIFSGETIRFIDRVTQDGSRTTIMQSNQCYFQLNEASLSQDQGTYRGLRRDDERPCEIVTIYVADQQNMFNAGTKTQRRNTHADRNRLTNARI